MKALVWKSKNEIELVEKPYPEIKNDTDVIVKVTLSSICTSDLHIINGFVPKAKLGVTLGHEFVGEVVQIGSKITNLKIGDRVSANCETFCGECFYCKRGYVNNCVNGGWELGCTIDGCQAEYVRVPFGHTGLTKLPDNVSDEDSLFVGDILSSGYFGAELCEVSKGDTVVVIGCGPVGMCAMISTKIMNAKTIIALDIDEYRLDFVKNKNLADIVINPEREDYLKIIQNLTDGRGADAVIECAGGENTFDIAWRVARANAIVGIVGMYEKSQTLPLPDMYGKNLVFKTGGVDATHCEELVSLIAEGKIDTKFLISKTEGLENIIEAYEYFKGRKNNCFKIAIK